jgi:hypothetical protein
MPAMDRDTQIAFLLHVFRLMFNTPHTAWAQTGIGQEWQPWVVGYPSVRGKLFVNGTVRAMDVALMFENNFILRLRMMEQNKNKTDAMGMLKPTALRAQRGEQIMWVLNTNQEPNAWLGSIQNGQWHPSKEQAVTPASPGAPSTPTSQESAMSPEYAEEASLPELTDDFIDMDMIPEVDMDVDEFVMEHATGDEYPEDV